MAKQTTKVGLEDSINPVSSDDLASYQLANFDTSTSTIYIGKVDKDGQWFIKQMDTVTEEALYARGDTDFATAWSDRLNLTYDTFDNLF